MSEGRDLFADRAPVDLLGALRSRHSGDVFIPECKLGATWGPRGHRRMDAWVLRCSWTNWGTVGYEIKHSRADFRQDRKWREYLPVCSLFYFVCPADLIDASEVEDPAGLLWLSRTGKALRTKKAPRLIRPEPEALVSLFSYVLMSRFELSDRPRFGRLAIATEATRHEQTLLRLMRERREKRVGRALSRVMAERRRNNETDDR